MITSPNIRRVGDQSIGDNIAIVAFESEARVDPGSPLRVTIYWKAIGVITRDDVIHMALVDPTGQIRAETRVLPADGLYPPSRWQPGKILRESYLFSIPADVAAGNYDLTIDLLDPMTQVAVDQLDDSMKGIYRSGDNLQVRAVDMMFAWLSLFSVGFSDLYVRLCSMGVWNDWRIL